MSEFEDDMISRPRQDVRARSLDSLAAANEQLRNELASARERIAELEAGSAAEASAEITALHEMTRPDLRLGF